VLMPTVTRRDDLKRSDRGQTQGTTAWAEHLGKGEGGRGADYWHDKGVGTSGRGHSPSRRHVQSRQASTETVLLHVLTITMHWQSSEPNLTPGGFSQQHREESPLRSSNDSSSRRHVQSRQASTETVLLHVLTNTMH